MEEFRLTLGREISLFYAAGEVAAIDLPDEWIVEYVTALIELQERGRKAPGKRIRGARYNPNHDPETTIGDDLDVPAELDVNPNSRLF